MPEGIYDAEPGDCEAGEKQHLMPIAGFCAKLLTNALALLLESSRLY